MGWMSNWDYANVVPTRRWRSAMTVPRELKLHRENGELHLAGLPVAELDKSILYKEMVENLTVNGVVDLRQDLGKTEAPFILDMELDSAKDFQLIFSNKAGERLVLGYEAAGRQFFIDRTQSGETGFHPSFAGRHTAPRIRTSDTLKFSLIYDVSSLELFADDGLSVLTSVFFNRSGFDKLELSAPEKMVLRWAGLNRLGKNK